MGSIASDAPESSTASAGSELLPEATPPCSRAQWLSGAKEADLIED